MSVLWYLENSPLSSLQYPFDPRSGDMVVRATSSGSLAPTLSTRSNPDHLKRISYSEVALNKAPPGPILVQDDLHFPGFNPASTAIITYPRVMSRSHHNLGQMPESPEHRVAKSYQGQLHSPLSQASTSQVASHFQQHQRASSDSNSLLLQQDKWVQRVETQSKTHIQPEKLWKTQGPNHWDFIHQLKKEKETTVLYIFTPYINLFNMNWIISK